MFILGLVAWAVVWIAIAFWPARVAQRKGYSFAGFFIFSIFLFPVALIVAYLIHDKFASEHLAEHEREKELDATMPHL